MLLAKRAACCLLAACSLLLAAASWQAFSIICGIHWRPQWIIAKTILVMWLLRRDVPSVFRGACHSRCAFSGKMWDNPTTCTYLLTHWGVDHSLMHWIKKILDPLAHRFLESVIGGFIASRIYWFAASLPRWIFQSVIRWFTGSLFHWPLESLNHWFVIDLFVHYSIVFILKPIRWFTGWLVHCFIHVVIRSCLFIGVSTIIEFICWCPSQLEHFIASAWKTLPQGHWFPINHVLFSKFLPWRVPGTGICISIFHPSKDGMVIIKGGIFYFPISIRPQTTTLFGMMILAPTNQEIFWLGHDNDVEPFYEYFWRS